MNHGKPIREFATDNTTMVSTLAERNSATNMATFALPNIGIPPILVVISLA
jgi:hypothetical protein